MRYAFLICVPLTFTVLSCVAASVKSPVVVSCVSSKPGTNARSGPALVGERYGRQISAIPLDSVQFSNRVLARNVAILDLSSERTSADTIQVTALFVSCSKKPQSVRVRTSFTDDRFVPTERASAWKTVFLQPKLTAAYGEYSMSTRATHFMVEITPQE